MNLKNKLMKSSIVITAVVSLFIMSGNTMAAQPGAFLNNSNSVLALIDSDAVSSGLDETTTCSLATLISSMDEVSSCGDDSTCKATAVFEMVIDILLCANPDDNNVMYVACLTEAIIDMLEVSATCDGDNGCVMQSMIPLVVKIMNCKSE
jgi:hypothetical protein